MGCHLPYGITVLPATPHKRTHPALTIQACTWFTNPERMEVEKTQAQGAKSNWPMQPPVASGTRTPTSRSLVKHANHHRLSRHDCMLIELGISTHVSSCLLGQTTCLYIHQTVSVTLAYIPINNVKINNNNTYRGYKKNNNNNNNTTTYKAP